jgi:hypothetical protein
MSLGFYPISFSSVHIRCAHFRGFRTNEFKNHRFSFQFTRVTQREPLVEQVYSGFCSVLYIIVRPVSLYWLFYVIRILPYFFFLGAYKVRLGVIRLHYTKYNLPIVCAYQHSVKLYNTDVRSIYKII